MQIRKTSFLQLLLNIIFFIPATLKISGEWLTKRAYREKWTRSIPVALIGVALSFLGGWQIADVVAFKYNLGSFTWFLSFLAATTLIFTHAWSSLYYFFLRHVWNLLDKLWRAYERLFDDGIHPFFEVVTGILSQFPGAESLWKQLETEYGSRSKGVRFLEAGLVVTLFGLAGYAGYLTYSWVLTMVAGFIAPATLAGTAALVAAILVFYLASPWFNSKSQPTVVAYSALISWAAVTYLPWATAQSIGVKAGIAGGSFVFATAYLIPLLVVALQGGFIAKVLKYWAEITDSCYREEEDKDFQRFFQHQANIVLAAAIAWVFYSLSVAAALPPVLASAISFLVLIYSYAVAFHKHIGSRSGNRDIAHTTLLIVAYGIYQLSFATSTAANFGLAVAAWATTGAFLYPLSYIALRFVTRPAAPRLGVALEALHGKLAGKILVAYKALREKQDATFDDRSDFAAFFGHVLNVTILALALTQGLPALEAYTTTSFWLDTAIVVFVTVNGFVLLGRLFSSYGGATLGFAGSLITLATTAYYVNAITGSLVAGLTLGLAAAYIVGGILAPLTYLPLAKYLAGPTSGITTLVKKLFDFLWEIYKALWIAIGKQFKFVLWLLAPVFALVAKTWEGISNSLKRIWG
jgi:hypothetical protein